MEKKENSMVNHPVHYNSNKSGIECIDVIEHMTLCVGNAMKYLWRSGLKQEQGMARYQKQIEDLEKAKWYVQREIDRISKLYKEEE